MNVQQSRYGQLEGERLQYYQELGQWMRMARESGHNVIQTARQQRQRAARAASQRAPVRVSLPAIVDASGAAASASSAIALAEGAVVEQAAQQPPLIL